MLPHNPPAISWGDQKLVVKLDVKRSNQHFIPVWRRGSALLNTVFYPFYHLWYDLRMVMAYNPEDVGSKPTTGIHFFLMKCSFH